MNRNSDFWGYNNSYIIYIINRFYYRIRNFTAKQINGEKYALKLKRKQSECIWCKKIHIKNDYFCSKKCKKLYQMERYQSFKHNNRCQKHKFQKLTYKNLCWDCYKAKFNRNFPRMKTSLLLKLHGFKTIPTFRTSRENWNGDKVAFEQNLKDSKIKWFVYIKFYESKNGKIKPIVVGKSGSCLVNNSGSDLNFSTDVKDGSARQFMHYNKLSWHYEHIMIKKCKNESHSYQVENYIMNKFDLFGS